MKPQQTLSYTIAGAVLILLGLLWFFVWRRKVALPARYLYASNRIKQYIKQEEQLRLVAYADPGGVLTIGWGHTSDRFQQVYPGLMISEARAEELFEHDIKEAENWVRSRLRVNITGNQFDALVSHTFNTGGSPGLMNLVNNQAHPDDIYAWFTGRYVSQNGQQLRGLVSRRKEEAEIFFT